MKIRYVPNPVVHNGIRGETDGIERGSFVNPHKDNGGKRKGRSMKRKPRMNSARVTLDNLKTARDNGGYWDKELRCVVYRREL